MMPETHSEPYQRSKMECVAKIVNAKNMLPIFAKSFILDVWQGSEYPFGSRNLFFFTYF